MKLNQYILILAFLGLPAGLFAMPDADTTDVIISDSLSTSISKADSLSGVSMYEIGAPESSAGGFGEEEAERSTSISKADSLSGVSADEPSWYVAPEIPEALRAPMRTTVSGCLTDSILTFNVDSVLTELTAYDYDDVGRTIRTTVWTCLADGTRIGKSKQEYAFDASGTQVYTGTFAWDTNTDDWRGTSKSEYVYNDAHKMESNITYTWVNNAWLPSQALTYAYDAAGRVAENTTYTRNASVNHLVPSKQLINVWYNASKKTLEIQYTAYTNGAWSAGTKKEYDYDASGNQIEYTYYASYSGGNWVGSTHELWTYNTNNKKTYYKKETWTNNEWKTSNEEFTDYDAAGNTTRVENYALKNGVLSGSKKETYTYNAAKKKTSTITYKWTNDEWVNNVWTVSGYDAAGNANESCKYNWKNNAWVGTGTRTLKLFNSNKEITEQITQTWPTSATGWVNATRKTTTYDGSKTIQEASYNWQNDDWHGISRADYYYNTIGQNDTVKTYINNGIDWINSNRTVNTYNAEGIKILTHNAKWENSTWVMTSMTRTDIIKDVNEHVLLRASWQCSSDSVWIGTQKDTAYYSPTGKPLCVAYYTAWSNNDWVPSYKVEYEYDEADREIVNRRMDWSNNKWQGHYLYEYAYDDQGRQIAYTYYGDWNGSTNSWIGGSKYDYTYAANGQYSGRIMYVWRNNQWENLFKYQYVYDSANREIEQLVQIYSNNNWQNIQKYVHEYSGNLLVKNNEYTWQNEQWTIISCNESYYDEDAQAKLRRSVVGSWNSSTGNVLSYTDRHYFYSCDAPTGSNGSQPRTPTGTEEEAEFTERILDNNNENTLITTQPVYNLQGQRVDPATYRGIVIQNGKKYVL